jgi:hypothetical protein
MIFSSKDSSLHAYVIPTDEEGTIPSLAEQTISACSSHECEQAPAGQLQTLILLSRTTDGLISSLDREWDVEAATR